MILLTREIALRVELSISFKLRSALSIGHMLQDRTYIVLVGVYGLSVESFLSLVAVFHMLTDPYVSVKSKNKINTAWQNNEM